MGKKHEEKDNIESAVGGRKDMGHKKGFFEKHIKRPQDFLCALLACIVLSPVMLVIAILVKIKRYLSCTSSGR